MKYKGTGNKSAFAHICVCALIQSAMQSDLFDSVMSKCIYQSAKDLAPMNEKKVKMQSEERRFTRSARYGGWNRSTKSMRKDLKHVIYYD